ncbi:MAG: hypothetical protein JNM70_12675 [Anaerolineae bacterium]|nr:hypothetical protein [Anaerolineae bacterium]
MLKRYRWLGSALLTAANIGLLLLTYFALVMPAASSLTASAPSMQIMTPGLATFAPTPTPIPLVNILIAFQNLPRGYRFPDRIDELWNVVGYVAWPEQSLPFSALYEWDGGLELLLGKVLRVDVVREQPLLSTMLVDSMAQLGSVGSDVGAMLPTGTVATTVRLNRELMPTGLAVGDHVNVFYSIVGSKEGEALGETGLLVDNAVVMWIGEIPFGGRINRMATPTPVPNDSSSQFSPTSTPYFLQDETIYPLVLAVTNQDAAKLVWAEHNQVKLSLVIRSAEDTSPAVVRPVEQNSISP